MLGTGSVAKGGQRLFCVIVCRSHVCDHDSLCVASERVLQDSGELGVTVGDVGTLGVRQTRDNVAECRERQVDFCRFFEPLAGRASFALTLRARQIYDVQFAHFDMRLALLVHLRALHSDSENGVGA